MIIKSTSTLFLQCTRSKKSYACFKSFFLKVFFLNSNSISFPDFVTVAKSIGNYWIFSDFWCFQDLSVPLGIFQWFLHWFQEFSICSLQNTWNISWTLNLDRFCFPEPLLHLFNFFISVNNYVNHLLPLIDIYIKSCFDLGSIWCF